LRCSGRDDATYLARKEEKRLFYNANYGTDGLVELGRGCCGRGGFKNSTISAGAYLSRQTGPLGGRSPARG